MARSLWLPLWRKIGVDGPEALAAQGSWRAKVGARRSKMPSCAISQCGRVTQEADGPTGLAGSYGRALWALSVLPVTVGCQPVTIAGSARCLYGVASRGRAQTCTYGRGGW